MQKINPLRTTRILLKFIEIKKFIDELAAMAPSNVAIFEEKRSGDLMIAYEELPVVPKILNYIRSAKYKSRGKKKILIKIYKKRYVSI